MRRNVLVLSFFMIGVLGSIGLPALAQTRPPIDATPGAVGVSRVPLGAIDPVATGCRWWN